MFFFIPYNTDAPIYHWPVVTVGLIVVNILAFVGLVQAPNPEVIRPWILEFGRGLHPTQWITANFVHLGLMHLVGNMFALWGFGLLVEGKLGWWRFLAVYLGMGVGQCALLQMVVPASVGSGCAGASGIIFGLMAMALVWAPMNEISWFGFVWFLLFIRAFCFDLAVWACAAIMGTLQFITASLSGMAFGSETLHLVGASFGLAVGIAMFRLGWVDCENWDMFSVWAGRHKMSYDQIVALREGAAAPRECIPVDPQKIERLRQSSLNQIQKILVDGRHELAYAAHRKMAGTIDGWRLPEPWFRGMIAGYHRAQRFTESIPLMVEYLRTYTEQAPLVRLKLAEILLRHASQPAQARRVLQKIPPGALDESQEAYRRKLEQLANRSSLGDVLELQPQDW